MNVSRTRLRRIADLGLALSAAVALAGALLAVAVALHTRRDASADTCQRIAKLRTDLVQVLQTAENLSIRRPDLDAREKTLVIRFYQQQIRRVRPVRCS